MAAYNLAEMARLLDVAPDRIRNWTVGRPFRIEASVFQGGQGSVNLYSIEDVYLMAIALEFSKTGFAANAIGHLVKEAKPLLDAAVNAKSVWTLWRVKPAGPFRIMPGGPSAPNEVNLSVRFCVGAVIAGVDKRLKSIAKSGK
jgi:hypothetical protein